jgi:SPP1 gp7 family putative phage head morphogenesis protein
MHDEYLNKDPDTIKLMQENKVKLSKENINRVLSLPWSGKNYSENIRDNSYFIAKKVKTMVAKNIIAGKSVQNLTRELTKIYGKQYRYNAQRLIRTELAYVKGQADILTYDKLNIDKYEILATLDNRTSSICQSMDGKVFPISDIKIGINYPPFHPNCRTTTVKYRENTENKTRLAKDASGKNVKVPFNMKYDERKNWVTVESIGIEGLESRSNKYVVEKLISGAYGNKINKEKQTPHIESTAKPGKSYLFNHVNAQELFNKYAGTGIIELDRRGNMTNK